MVRRIQQGYPQVTTNSLIFSVLLGLLFVESQSFSPLHVSKSVVGLFFKAIWANQDGL